MHKKHPVTERQQATLLSVKKLYESSSREMGRWMWQNHVQWVAGKAAELAHKYGANVDKTFAAALLHDFGDVWMERSDEGFDEKSAFEAKQILMSAGFNDDETQEIIDHIIAPHSCYEGEPLPDLLEAQVMATADGLAHLLTDFYNQFEKLGQPTSDKDEFRKWASRKVERDYSRKLFFEDERNVAKKRYEELSRYFSDD